MRTALVLTAAALAALSLAACQKKPAAGNAASNTAAGGASTTAAAPSAAPSGGNASLTAADLPRAKPGLWKVKFTNSMLPRPIEYSNCVKAEDTKIDWSGKGGARHCEPSNLSRGLDGSIHGSATCAIEGAQVAMEMRASGDYQSHYAVHIDQTVTGAPMAQFNGKHTMDIDAVYAGPCTK
ncbi:MAG TPA: DUF3617 family protein [Caulobacteraceae bacterium]|jgi:hypothetical protein